MQDPDSQIPGRPPPSPWDRADAAFATRETALKTAAVEDPEGFDCATNHLRKISDMRLRFAARRPVVERGKREG